MTVHRHDSGGREILGTERVSVDREGAVKRDEPLADLVVRRRVELAALRIIKEVVHGIVRPLRGAVIIAGGSMITHVTSATHGLVVNGSTTIRGWMRMMRLVVAASMTGWMRRLTKGGRVSTHLAIVIIVARRCWEAELASL